MQAEGRAVFDFGCPQVDVDAQTEYMVALAQRCAENEASKQRALAAKFLQPLTQAKKIRRQSMEAHLAKLERLFQGQKAAE